jgi:hypothetical protein
MSATIQPRATVTIGIVVMFKNLMKVIAKVGAPDVAEDLFPRELPIGLTRGLAAVGPTEM